VLDVDYASLFLWILDAGTKRMARNDGRKLWQGFKLEFSTIRFGERGAGRNDWELRRWKRVGMVETNWEASALSVDGQRTERQTDRQTESSTKVFSHLLIHCDSHI